MSFGAYLKIEICTPNSPLCTVILLLVVWSLLEGQNLYTKWSSLYSNTVTCCMKPIWRRKFVQQIVPCIQKYCCLSYEAYLKIKIWTQNSPLPTVILLLVLWSLFEGQICTPNTSLRTVVILLLVVWSLFEDWNLYTKYFPAHSNTVTFSMKPLWRLKFLHQIVLSVW